MFHIGHVCKTHGIYGCFSIKLSIPEDLCAVFKNLKTIYLEDHRHPLSVTNIILNNSIFLKTKVKSINSREEVKSILRKNIYIKKGDHKNIDLIIDEKNKFLNFKVIDEKNGEIGFVKEIDFNRPQSLFIIKSKNKTILIPYVDQLITKIDEKNKEINLDLPQGLIDICGE